MVELYEGVVRGCQRNFFARLSETDLHLFAMTNVKGIIARFEGVQISLERTEQNLFEFFRQGATLQDFTQLLNAVEESFGAETKRLLKDRPELADYILQKVAYIRQAYGSTVALAMHNYQKSLF